MSIGPRDAKPKFLGPAGTYVNARLHQAVIGAGVGPVSPTGLPN